MAICLLQECNCYLLLFELAFSLCTKQEMHMWYIQINSCRIQVFQGIQGSSKKIRRVTFFYCIAKCFGVYRNTSQLKRVCSSLLGGYKGKRWKPLECSLSDKLSCSTFVSKSNTPFIPVLQGSCLASLVWGVAPSGWQCSR